MPLFPYLDESPLPHNFSTGSGGKAINSQTSPERTTPPTWDDLPTATLLKIAEILEAKAPSIRWMEGVAPDHLAQLNFDLGRRSFVYEIDQAIERKKRQPQESESTNVLRR